MRRKDIQYGLEVLLQSPPQIVKSAKLGLVMNQASVDHQLQYACDLIADRFPMQLIRLFSPQHGLWCEQQANMIESADSLYLPLKLPVHSLYSQTRRPTAEMLEGLDVLLIDLQDVGTRVYTFIWTMWECLKACADAKVSVVVLDRPNPLGGEVLEGPLLEDGFQSFVGNACIPLRHGLTIGELARYFVREFSLAVDLTVIPMRSWNRSDWFCDLQRTWVSPSPNMQRFQTTIVYPGQVLLEGVALSEGRGTTLPFEYVGGPGLNPFLLSEELSQFEHPGLRLRPVRFVPTFDKWKGKSCGGVALHVIDPKEVRSVSTTVSIIACARRQSELDTAWLPPPYEYEYHKPPIDILFGSTRLREAIDSHSVKSPGDIQSLIEFDQSEWRERTRMSRLYD